MIDIPFSQNYLKFPKYVRVADTYLLGFFRAQKADLPLWFLRYDTAYLDKDGEVRYYELKDTELLVLQLATTPYIGPAQQFLDLWTTCRTWSADKEAMFQGAIGKQVKIKISEG